LWCLPEFASIEAAGDFARAAFGEGTDAPRTLATVEHGFTHFDLSITPLLVRCRAAPAQLREGGSLWYNIRTPARIGLPAPITALLAGLAGPQADSAQT
jgi:A/G-specific adenine glycosylase